MANLQSEHPRVAKKAEENKIQAKPVEKQGWAMAVARKADEQLEARADKVPEEGEGSGYFSQFLHDWCQNIMAAYQEPAGPRQTENCYLSVGYYNGHVVDIGPGQSCENGMIQEALADAVRRAPRPPMPTSFGGQHLELTLRLGSAH